MPEDERVVAKRVHSHGGQADQHAHAVFADGAQREDAHVAHRKRQVAEPNDAQVLHAQRDGARVADKDAHDALRPQRQPQAHAQRGRQPDDHLQRKQGAAGLEVARAVVLADEQSRRARHAEKHAEKDGIRAVGHRHGAHGQAAGVQAAHHQVVDHVEEVVDQLLNRDGGHHPQRAGIEAAAAHKGTRFLKQGLHRRLSPCMYRPNHRQAQGRKPRAISS